MHVFVYVYIFLYGAFFIMGAYFGKQGEGKRVVGGLTLPPAAGMAKKKAPAASWFAATGLVKSWVAIFTEKSACGKLVSSNRACQVPAKVRSGPKTSNLARTGSRIDGLG